MCLIRIDSLLRGRHYQQFEGHPYQWPAETNSTAAPVWTVMLASGLKSGAKASDSRVMLGQGCLRAFFGEQFIST